MTGQGQGQAKDESLAVSIELRAINSRFLKVNFNNADSYGGLIGDLESMIRENVRRGTINVHVRIEDQKDAQQVRLNSSVLQAYKNQLEQIFPDQSVVNIESLLSLPGVIDDSDQQNVSSEAVAAVANEAMAAAIESLNEMRQREGQAMGQQLIENCNEIAEIAKAVQGRTHLVVESYAERLQDRINQMLSKMDAEIDRKDIVREVGIFADRCDINEELVRLQSHVEQFEQIIGSPESSGRKLDFLTQELLRETNTIGSKSNDAEIAGHVVQMKTTIERIREMVQNIE